MKCKYDIMPFKIVMRYVLHQVVPFLRNYNVITITTKKNILKDTHIMFNTWYVYLSGHSINTSRMNGCNPNQNAGMLRCNI